MKQRWNVVALFVGFVLIAVLPTQQLWAETLVSYDVNTRVILAFQAPEAALGKWLPSGWQLSPVPSGPNKGANLFMSFVERILIVDPDGKPVSTGTDRYLVLVVPAVPPNSDTRVNVVIRVYYPAEGPGAYKNSRPVSITREQSRHGSARTPADGFEFWEVKDNTGGVVTVRLKYHGGVPVRSNSDLKFYSAVVPDFYRIYRSEQGMDFVRSVADGVDRVEGFEFSVTIPELQEMLGDNKSPTSIAIAPWIFRQILLP